MNDPISWDPSLVKKFSSSNHYKLLNQLRNEVKKYPLNNKQKTSSIQRRGTNLDNNNNSNSVTTLNNSFSNNYNPSNDVNSNKSTVSFNNAKNFSIYNQTSMNNNNSGQNQSFIIDKSNSNEEYSSPDLNDQVNQMDMK